MPLLRWASMSLAEGMEMTLTVSAVSVFLLAVHVLPKMQESAEQIWRLATLNGARQWGGDALNQMESFIVAGASTRQDSFVAWQNEANKLTRAEGIWYRNSYISTRFDSLLC